MSASKRHSIPKCCIEFIAPISLLAYKWNNCKVPLYLIRSVQGKENGSRILYWVKKDLEELCCTRKILKDILLLDREHRDNNKKLQTFLKVERSILLG